MGLIHDSEEHKAIRESVAGIAQRYGAQYFIEPVSRNLSSIARGNKQHTSNWTAKARSRLEMAQ